MEVGGEMDSFWLHRVARIVGSYSLDLDLDSPTPVSPLTTRQVEFVATVSLSYAEHL